MAEEYVKKLNLPPIDLEKVALMRASNIGFPEIADILGVDYNRLKQAFKRSGLREEIAEAKRIALSLKPEKVTKPLEEDYFSDKREKIVARVVKMTEALEDPKKEYLKNASIVVNRVARNLSITETDDARQMAAQSVTLKTINDVAKTVYGLEKNIGESFDFDMSPLLEEALPSRQVKQISEALPETLENSPETPPEP